VADLIILDMLFLDYKIITLLLLGRGAVAIAVIAYIFLNSRGTSTHIADRCVNKCTWSKRPGLILIVSHVWLSMEGR
jgi:hypothetical protein